MSVADLRQLPAPPRRELLSRPLQLPPRPPPLRSFAAYCADVGETADVRCGIPQPLGAHEFEGGVNFALLSRDAARVQLELFARAEDLKPCKVIDLDPARNRTGDIWHIWIKDLPQGQLYTFRTHSGDKADTCSAGERLLDPYATAIEHPVGNQAVPKCVFTCEPFEWGEDAPPRHPWSQTVIYETHVRGFTEHPSSGVQCRGTFRAVIEKIPYLKELGVTAIELLPVQEFEASRCSARNPLTGQPLRNYWGYDPIALLAPHGGYSSVGDSGGQTREFQEMVRALHVAGIEVIIDIALPRTTGAIRPPMRQSIVDALRYWVAEMHVDGFRLDLASLLGRDSSGKLLSNPFLLEEIAEDPILHDAKLIAAAWDAAGAYRVASFQQRRWTEWNGLYRNDVRRFWRGDEGMLAAFASRICGSEDLYRSSGKGPECSVNFVACHDGFTLNDVVSFQCKHNLPNGEDNCDGGDAEYSANYRAEGPTADLRIEAVRNRQVKNFLLTLFMSRGVPMLLGGDEFRRTQQGNNNAYCQDNDTSWYDWRCLKQHADIHAFVRRVIALRREHPVLSRERFYTPADISWFSPGLKAPDWSDPRAKALGCLVRDDSRDSLYFMFNAEDKCMSFRIPHPPEHCRWRLEVATASELPVSGAGPLVPGGSSYTLEPRSSAVLVASPNAPDVAKESPDATPAAKTAPVVTTGGCNPLIDACARAMGGDDPDVAYAAAMLWYQGYPEAPHPGT